MAQSIQIRLMGSFSMLVDGLEEKRIGGRAGKASAVMQYLIVHRDQSVPTSELMEVFWDDEDIDNPESALKTLISRQRALLNEISDGLGRCIVSGRGSYAWQSNPNVEIDLYALQDMLNIAEDRGAAAMIRNEACEKVIELYQGNLLENCMRSEWARLDAAQLMKRFGECVNSYAERMLAAGENKDVVRVCSGYIKLYNLDDRVYCSLISALLRMGQVDEARDAYRQIANMHFRCLGDKPGEELQQLYLDSIQLERKDFNIDILCNELKDSDNAEHAYVCEYPVFKALFNFHVRNLDRMSLSMTMGIITLKRADGKAMSAAEQDTGILKLMNLLQCNLRKSDAVTRFSSSVVAVLLSPPLSDFEVMISRIKRIFYQQYGKTGLLIEYQSCDIGSQNGAVVQSMRAASQYAGAKSRK